MSDNSTTTPIALTTFKQMPKSGDAVFLINGDPVRFVVAAVGELRGWAVTTSDPGYRGFLSGISSTTMGARGPELNLDYGFEYGNPGSLPLSMSVRMNPVTIVEFKEIYFGESSIAN